MYGELDIYKWTAATRLCHNLCENRDEIFWADTAFGGKPLDLTICIIINKICGALRPQKCMSGPLGPPKNMCSLWLH